MGKGKPRSADFEQVLDGFLKRRSLLRGALAAGAASVLPACSESDARAQKTAPKNNSEAKKSSLSFTGLEQGLGKDLHVAKGYRAQVLLSWGDPIFDDAEEFDPLQQSAEKQLKQFGFNNDFVGFVPLGDSRKSNHGLLVVNHEYPNGSMMFPDLIAGAAMTAEQIDVEIAALGLSIIEIKREGEIWHVLKGSQYNRRITPWTEMQMTGPAAGSQRLRSILSDDGIKTVGTYGNCAGGVTPWGTVLTGEENVDDYFSGDASATPERENYERFRCEGGYDWGKFHPRWDLQKNPNGLLHVGWIVEIDPSDPNSVPKKRTSLGRFKHEGCNVHVNVDGHIVAYAGDDAQFEYIYKFVSQNKYQPENRQANMDLLEEGTLYVAKFNDDGSLQWLPLVFGSGPLTQENGFNSQGDVCLDARKAADLLGATPMDRPEDVDVNEVNGHVYAMLTNNNRRKSAQLDAANPRAHNRNGQIIEFWPENGDHQSDVFAWDLFLLAGNPRSVTTKYHPNTDENGWLSCPDNCAFDSLGNIWIATDGAEKAGVADGVWAAEVHGANKALTKRFLRTPIGAELCGPFFTPDDENFFCAVQHPGDKSGFHAPSTRWPDFDPDMPPRSSLVVVTKIGGGRIGS